MLFHDPWMVCKTNPAGLTYFTPWDVIKSELDESFGFFESPDRIKYPDCNVPVLTACIRRREDPIFSAE